MRFSEADQILCGGRSLGSFAKITVVLTIAKLDATIRP
jgi:hypothetical protein